MTESRTIHDPFLQKTVKISNRLTDRLRGKYACGPTLPNGEPEFGWRQHETPPIQHEAADLIDKLLGNWRDIRSAPKNGSSLLLAFKDSDGEWCQVQGWFEDGPADLCWYDVFDERITPTHWRPLFDPPAS